MKNETKHTAIRGIAYTLLVAFGIVTLLFMVVLGHAAAASPWYAQVGYSAIALLWIASSVLFYIPIILDTLNTIDERYEES